MRNAEAGNFGLPSQREKSTSLQSNLETIGHLSKYLDGITVKALEQNPSMGTYGLFKALKESLPRTIPEEVKTLCLQSIKSENQDISALGRKSLLFLNARTIVGVVDLYFIDGVDKEEDREEMIGSGITSALASMPNLKEDLPVAQQIHDAASHGAVNYISGKDNMPYSWIKSPITRKLIIKETSEHFAYAGSNLDEKELWVLSEELGKLTQIRPESFFKYLRRMRLYGEKGVGSEDWNYDQTVGQAEENEQAQLEKKLREKITQVFKTFTERERRVTRMRMDGKSLRVIGRELGLSAETVRLTEKKALRKIKNPTKKRVLKPFEDIGNPDLGRVMPVNYKESPSSSQVKPDQELTGNKNRLVDEEKLDLLSINAVFPPEQVTLLIEKGISEIGDFFNKSESDLKELGFDWDDLKKILLSVLSYLGFGKSSNIEQDGELLNRITDVIAFRKNILFSENEREERIRLYRKNYNRLASFILKISMDLKSQAA